MNSHDILVSDVIRVISDSVQIMLNLANLPVGIVKSFKKSSWIKIYESGRWTIVRGDCTVSGEND